MKKISQEVINKLINSELTIATAESCTGGGISYALTNISGSSEVFDRGYITYSNKAKTDMLDVPLKLLEKYGAVSKQVAIKMAEGAKKNSKADIAIAITGIAGPSGASYEKPVGLVHLSIATKNKTTHEKHYFNGNREKIRNKSIKTALTMILKYV